jgi:hypothetical protein
MKKVEKSAPVPRAATRVMPRGRKRDDGTLLQVTRRVKPLVRL